MISWPKNIMGRQFSILTVFLVLIVRMNSAFFSRWAIIPFLTIFLLLGQRSNGQTTNNIKVEALRQQLQGSLNLLMNQIDNFLKNGVPHNAKLDSLTKKSLEDSLNRMEIRAQNYQVYAKNRLLNATVAQGQTDMTNLDSIYQSILDNKKFVKKILKEKSFLCNGTLYLMRNSSDSIFTSKLTFHDRPLITADTTDCPYLSFELSNLSNDSYKLSATIHKTTGQSGSCVFYKTIYYTCTLTKSGGKYEISNIKIGSGRAQAKF